MIAKYKGFCVACQRPVFPGQEINRRSSDDKWVHKACPSSAAPRAAAPAPAPAPSTGDYREMAARFDSICVKCNGQIAEGDLIWYRKGEKAFHAACAHTTNGAVRHVDPEVEQARREREHADARYEQGKRDVENWHENRRMFGDEMAERMEIEREMREDEEFDW